MPPDTITILGKTHALNFTYDQLERKVNGAKNIGELKFGSDGKLHRVNRHATFTGLNKTVLTGEENFEARSVIWTLISSRWEGDRSDVRRSLLREAYTLLLGDAVAHEPVSRDEVRMILSMLKKGYNSKEEMSDAVMFVRHIKKTGDQNVFALLEQRGFPEDAVSFYVKGWNLSTAARKRSDNFANWTERANALEMDKLLSESKVANVDKKGRMEAFKRDFTLILVNTLRTVGVEVNQPVGRKPGAYKAALNDALEKLSLIKDKNTVTRIKAELRERMMQNVEDMLLSGNGQAASPQTDELQKALQEMSKDVAAVLQNLQTVFPSKNPRDCHTAMIQTLDGCGVDKATIQSKFIEMTVLHLDGRTEKRQVEDTPENHEKFALDKEPYGAGQGRVCDVRYMAKVRTDPVLSAGNAQGKVQVIPQDACFEISGLDKQGGMFTLVNKAESLQKQYVERIKGKLAWAFDDIFGGTSSLSEGCRKLLGERANLFTRTAINLLAQKESATIQNRDIKTLTRALSQFFTSYNIMSAAQTQMTFTDMLDTYRCLEGPVEYLSIEDFGRRMSMRKEIACTSDILTTGRLKSYSDRRVPEFDGLGFGFPSGLEKEMGLSVFYLSTHWIRGEQHENIAHYGKIINMCCRLVKRTGGQDAVDAIALNLLSKYKLSDTELDKGLFKGERRQDNGEEDEDVGFDVLGKLGEVVTNLVTSKEEKEEKQDQFRTQNAERIQTELHARENRCKRARNAIKGVLEAMGYRLAKAKVIEGPAENAKGAAVNEVLVLAQGDRRLGMSESQPGQPAAVA